MIVVGVCSPSEMKLPKAESAKINRAKLVRYLLSEGHPVGRWKAKFFRGIGFDERNVESLEKGLMEIVMTEDIVATATSLHGEKYVVDGQITSPAGKRVRLRTVWIVDEGEEHGRFERPIRSDIMWREPNDSGVRAGCSSARCP
jgi:hypothetical protein